MLLYLFVVDGRHNSYSYYIPIFKGFKHLNEYWHRQVEQCIEVWSDWTHAIEDGSRGLCLIHYFFPDAQGIQMGKLVFLIYPSYIGISFANYVLYINPLGLQISKAQDVCILTAL